MSKKEDTQISDDLGAALSRSLCIAKIMLISVHMLL